ncbi:SRPBCC domain-containing protein [Herbaspirillum sp. RV1423]|uniref:SRPBCC family protein n=1 Tax=Herbaspirillum sp. RV1423 TaxID=1443993 RepID=UPI0004AD8973|nr:SRPBCC domain-containing protein [Herbaspirillum sp. RV1423]
MKKSDDSEHSDGENADLEPSAVIQQRYRLDASVGKVWRAISVPALREHWLPDLELASPDPIHSVPGQEIRYTMREAQPPFLESEVTLHIAPAPGGGTILTIIHAASAASDAANDGTAVYMCAA